MIPESIFDKDLWLKYDIERILRINLSCHEMSFKDTTDLIIERIKQSEEKYASVFAPQRS
jgi:hypothetical protein